MCFLNRALFKIIYIIICILIESHVIVLPFTISLLPKFREDQINNELKKEDFMTITEVVTIQSDLMQTLRDLPTQFLPDAPDTALLSKDSVLEIVADKFANMAKIYTDLSKAGQELIVMLFDKNKEIANLSEQLSTLQTPLINATDTLLSGKIAELTTSSAAQAASLLIERQARYVIGVGTVFAALGFVGQTYTNEESPKTKRALQACSLLGFAAIITALVSPKLAASAFSTVARCFSATQIG